MESHYTAYKEDSLHLNEKSPFFWDHVTRYWWATKLTKDKIVLDCACGKGYGTYILASSSKSVTGIDLNTISIEIAQRVFKKDNLAYKIADILSLEKLQDKFDVITAFEAIEHIHSDLNDGFITSLKRAISPSGKIIISTPNHDVVLKSRSSIPSFHINNFRSKELRTFLLKHFDDVQMIGQFRPKGTLYNLLFKFDYFNLRHVIKNLSVLPSKIQLMENSVKEDIIANSELKINPAFIDCPLEFKRYHFSSSHWRQAGLTIAICQNPKK
ncbi:MAG: hypothetical protein A2381_09415 [Bdellovibrionales bacterium RIFOXYB1_FULL_37_110]|nr:MAG: hypothetical protein A2417_03080 [Bdellovibrionales bacterium RIFOXYC1_FULL_37_79]OFZ59481.1 MAG: hypothetical protein A2381_09415 [Bdellovibrionales bacterium RIFOXYB1_FULL_37_110]OFZ64200.1 MAG: hypothetical protein A2577_12265 [Bdellovibrionales bacterium RIFOXYD1_FULL_36_51]